MASNFGVEGAEAYLESDDGRAGVFVQEAIAQSSPRIDLPVYDRRVCRTEQESAARMGLLKTELENGAVKMAGRGAGERGIHAGGGVSGKLPLFHSRFCFCSFHRDEFIGGREVSPHHMLVPWPFAAHFRF